MPCMCYDMEPNERQKESRLVCSFLTKLLPRLGLEVSDDIRMGATHEYGNVDHVDKHTALLCYWCENMTDSQKNTFLFSKSRKDGKISGLADWWEKHQEADRKHNLTDYVQNKTTVNSVPHPKTIYEKYVSGEPLTLNEVDYGIDFYKELANRLMHCGPTFRLAFKEANQVYLTLQSYKDAREDS